MKHLAQSNLVIWAMRWQVVVLGVLICCGREARMGPEEKKRKILLVWVEKKASFQMAFNGWFGGPRCGTSGDEHSGCESAVYRRSSVVAEGNRGEGCVAERTNRDVIASESMAPSKCTRLCATSRPKYASKMFPLHDFANGGGINGTLSQEIPGSLLHHTCSMVQY